MQDEELRGEQCVLGVLGDRQRRNQTQQPATPINKNPKPAEWPRARPRDERESESPTTKSEGTKRPFLLIPLSGRLALDALASFISFRLFSLLPYYFSFPAPGPALAAVLVLLFTRSFHLAASAVEKWPVLPCCSHHCQATTPTIATAQAAALNCGEDGGALLNMGGGAPVVTCLGVVRLFVGVVVEV